MRAHEWSVPVSNQIRKTFLHSSLELGSTESRGTRVSLRSQFNVLVLCWHPSNCPSESSRPASNGSQSVMPDNTKYYHRSLDSQANGLDLGLSLEGASPTYSSPPYRKQQQKTFSIAYWALLKAQSQSPPRSSSCSGPGCEGVSVAAVLLEPPASGEFP